MADAIAVLLLLLGLELVLGIDNILVISILVGRLPESYKNRARILGLALALAARIGMLFLLLTLSGLRGECFFSFSIRDLILLGGGFFLIWKAVSEIHHTVELRGARPRSTRKSFHSVFAVVFQIAVLDVVFSIDSVITAIGLTDKVWIIVISVIASFCALLLFSKPIGDFILAHPALKVLALAFLITIGVTIFLEGLHQHVPKAYIYLPMGFALLMEILQMRYEHNIKMATEVRSI
jgi:predicted tellurium resistance membrane protein TerC